MNISTEHKYDWDKETWDVIESYFRDKKVLIKHQTESYNYFVDNKIQKIINEFNPVISYSNFNQDLGSMSSMLGVRVVFRNSTYSIPSSRRGIRVYRGGAESSALTPAIKWDRT